MPFPLCSQGKNPGTHYIGGSVGPIASLGTVAKRKISCTCWELNPGCPAYSLVTILTKLSPLFCTIVDIAKCFILFPLILQMFFQSSDFSCL
jgi:hypothetical protein